MVAVARQFLLALWRFLEPGVCPAGAVLTEGSALCRCRLPLRPWCWWRRPEAFPGLPSKPS